MSVIALTAAAGFLGDNLTSITLNVDWFNYIGQTVSFSLYFAELFPKLRRLPASADDLADYCLGTAHVAVTDGTHLACGVPRSRGDKIPPERLTRLDLLYDLLLLCEFFYDQGNPL